MALWDTLTDAGSNVLGQVTETAGSLWESAASGVQRAGEILTNRWVREATEETQAIRREGEAIFDQPFFGTGPGGTPTFGGDTRPPERTAQPQPSTLQRFAIPAGALLVAGLVAFVIARR